jgi:uncharacterized membrane protein
MLLLLWATLATLGFNSPKVLADPVPNLLIQLNASGTLLLSWPPATAGYILEEAQELAGNWSEVPAQTNGDFRLQLQANRRFYRLRFVGANVGTFSLGTPLSFDFAAQGDEARFPMEVFGIDGFQGLVQLAVAGLPAGSTAEFQPNPAYPSTGISPSSVLILEIGGTSPSGNYNLEITGTSGQLVRKTFLSLTVQTPDFSLSASQTNLVILPGANTRLPINVSRTLGRSLGQVHFEVAGLPAGATAVFVPDLVDTNLTLLKIATLPTVPAGKYPLVITGTSGSTNHILPLDLAVVENLRFNLNSPLALVPVDQGGSASSDIYAFFSGQNDGEVDFTVTGLPPEANGWFDPSPGRLRLPGRATVLHVATGRGTPAGSYTLLVTGTCGGFHSTTWLSLQVVAPDFSIFAHPNLQSIAPGQKTNYYFSVGKVGGATNDVRITLGPFPRGVDGYLGQPFGGQTPIFVVSSSNAPFGKYPITITGISKMSDGSLLTRSNTVFLEIAAPDFNIASLPSTQILDQGNDATYELSIDPIRGYEGRVALAASGLPLGALASFRNNPIYKSTTLRISTSKGTPAGNYDIQLTGNDGSLIRSNTISLVVREPVGFYINTTKTIQSVRAGSSTNYTVEATRTGGYTDVVILSVSGLPQGASYSFDRNTLSFLDKTSALSIKTGTGVPAGSYPFVITASSATLTRTTTATLVVSSPIAPGYTLTSLDNSKSVGTGDSVSYEVHIERSDFSDPIPLSVSGLPSGATASFWPNPANGSGSTLTISTGLGTPAGTSTLKVTGTKGGIVRTTDLNLTVEAATTPDFVVIPNASPIVVSRGRTQRVVLDVRAINGFIFASYQFGGATDGTGDGRFSFSTPVPQAPWVDVTVSPDIHNGIYSVGLVCSLQAFTLNGTGGFITHSFKVLMEIKDPDFCVTLKPNPVVINPGQSAQFEVSLDPIAGFWLPGDSLCNTSFEISGLPPNATANVFVPNFLQINPTTQDDPPALPIVLTISNTDFSPLGTYSVTLTPTVNCGGIQLTHSVSATVVIKDPDFSLQITPTNGTVSQDKIIAVAYYAVDLALVGSYPIVIDSWSFAGLPPEIISDFTYGSDQAAILLVVPPNYPKGKYPFTFTLTLIPFGKTTRLTHSVQATLTVQ